MKILGDEILTIVSFDVHRQRREALRDLCSMFALTPERDLRDSIS